MAAGTCDRGDFTSWWSGNRERHREEEYRDKIYPSEACPQYPISSRQALSSSFHHFPIVQ
jgi:hypothetical protein